MLNQKVYVYCSFLFFLFPPRRPARHFRKARYTRGWHTKRNLRKVSNQEGNWERMLSVIQLQVQTENKKEKSRTKNQNYMEKKIFSCPMCAKLKAARKNKLTVPGLNVILF